MLHVLFNHKLIPKLLLPTLQHRTVSIIRDSENVGRYFMLLLTLVQLNHLLSVDGQVLVWIHHYAEQTGVGLGGGVF